MSRHYDSPIEPVEDTDEPEVESVSLIDLFYRNLFYTPELNPPEHHDEEQALNHKEYLEDR